MQYERTQKKTHISHDSFYNYFMVKIELLD